MTAEARARRDKSQRRDVAINLRATPQLRDLIDKAAALTGQNRTEFMLESSRLRAEDVLLDQRLFLLDQAQYGKFLRALDAPARPNEALKKLLAAKAPWDA